MLKIEGNHLSVAGIRFKLPQNFYIDIEGMESIHPDGLRLISPEQDCRIAFMTTEVEFDTPVKSLLDIFADDVLPIIDAVAVIDLLHPERHQDRQ